MDDKNKILEFKKRIKGLMQDDAFKSVIDTRDIARIENNHKYVECFINFKKGNVDAAINLAVEVLKWRNNRNINDMKVENLDQDLMKRGIVFVRGKALDNTRVVYFLVRRQTKDIKTQVQRILSLWLERIHQQETGKQITFLLDVSKSSMSNVDLGTIKFLLNCFTLYFPDLLERIIVLEMPWIMNAIWKIVKQWMTEDQRQRTVFCSFKELQQYIAPENLLSYMGGKDSWEYSFPPEKDEFPCLNQVNDGCSVPEASAAPPSIGRPYVDPCESDELICDDADDTLSPVDSENLIDLHQRRRNSLSRTRPNPDNMYSDYLSSKSILRKEYLRSKPDVERSFDYKDYSHSANPAEAGPFDERRKAELGFRSNFVNGVNLKSLLIMSPASDVIFRQEYADSRTGRYLSYITLTNLTRTDQVAYKIKTNSPDHYLVKPNCGFVIPGDTVTIFIYLNAGFEHSLSRDRFLVLYQRKGNATSVKEFWRTHSSKDMHYEHRVQVKFIQYSEAESEDVLPPSPSPPSPINVTPYGDLNRNFALKPAPSHVPANDNGAEDELQILAKEVLDLRTSILTVESNSDRLRSKLRFSLIMHCFVIFLLFYVVLKLFVLTSLLQLGQSWQ